ncbi:MAG: NADH-quinone oxidoreductase subunit A [Planctomycetota bacterium]
MLFQYQVVLVFLLVGLAMIAGPMLLLAIVRPHRPTREKLLPYECGKDPIGDTRIRFDMRFYTTALIFIVFDVEIAFLFPWARVFKDPKFKGIALVEGIVFVAILFLGLVYVWVKGDLDWVKTFRGQQKDRPPREQRGPVERVNEPVGAGM